MINVFFSYSHKDKTLRDELEKHLKILQRNGIIDTWHDRRIEGGQAIDDEISENLENAQIILLLVSSDFLNSDYCYDKEMARAMEKHSSGEARVIPVILRPCLWQDAPFAGLNAAPTDAKAVTKFTNLDDAFLDIAETIKQAAQTIAGEIPREKPTLPKPSGADVTTSAPRSSNLSITKEFSDQDKDGFLDEAFEYMAKFFESSLVELNKRNSDISSRFKRVDSSTFTASVYKNGEKVSECTVWSGGGSSFAEGIMYSDGYQTGKSSFNGCLSIEDDGQMLYLKEGMSFGGNDNSKLTFEGAAEAYWSRLISPLQRR